MASNLLDIGGADKCIFITCGEEHGFHIGVQLFIDGSHGKFIFKIGCVYSNFYALCMNCFFYCF